MKIADWLNIKIDGEKFLIKGDFKGTSGENLKGYYDFTPVFINAYLYTKIKIAFTKLIPCNIIGIATNGALLLAFLTGYFGHQRVNPIFIFPKRTENDAKKQYYGELNLNFPIILLDDVITTLKTLRITQEILLKNGIDLQELNKKSGVFQEKAKTRIICLKNRSKKEYFGNIYIEEISHD
jgi:orotate phosphoribosyltransferase